MARIKFGGLVDGVLGSIGGITYSHNRTGYYAKSRRTGRNPRSLPQTIRRAAFSRLPSAWAALSDAYRQDWALWAADAAQARTDFWDQTYYLTGYQAFVWISTCLQSVGRSIPSVPPTSPKPSAPTITSATPTESPDATCVWVWPAHEFDGVDLVVRHALSDSLTPAVFPARAALLTYYNAYPVPSAGVTESDLDDAYGVLVDGQRLWSQAARQTTDGYRSAWFTLYEDVT